MYLYDVSFLDAESRYRLTLSQIRKDSNHLDAESAVINGLTISVMHQFSNK